MKTSPGPKPSGNDGGKQSRPSPIKVFYSYADKDEEWQKELHNHLSALRRMMSIEEFHHGMVVPGQDPNLVIKEYLKQADIILLLISPDFFGEHYDSMEMKEIFGILTQSKKAAIPCIIPTLVRPVDLKDAKNIPFTTLKALPSDGIPIARPRNRDSAFVDVVRGIRKVIEELNLDLGKRTATEPVSRLFSLLLRRNPFFTGREDLLNQLRNNLKQKSPPEFVQPQALSGLPGVGKTQIAIEYAYRYRQFYLNRFLVSADTRETLIKEYTRIAVGLGLVKPDEDQILILQLLLNWLETNPQWLLVLDNADDIAMVQEFIPDEAKGHIILTTRATALGGVAKKLKIEEMPSKDGVTLLLRRAEIPPSQVRSSADSINLVIAKKIVKLVGGLPLAIDQAGAYIEETDCGLASYLRLYEKRRRDLLAMRGDIFSKTDHPESVVTTFLLAFEKVENANPLAADLLRLCAFLAPDAIPETLITRHLAQLPHFSNLASQPHALNEASRALLRYSLIRRDANMATLAVHRLVQAVLQDEMDERVQRQWAIRAVNLVYDAFPTSVDIKTWPECQMLLPHVLVCARLIDKYNLTISRASQLLDSAGSYLFQRGQYGEAKLLYEQALNIRERTMGSRDVSVAQSLHHLGELNERMGKYSEAEQQLQRALDIREQVLEEEAPDIATSLTGLAELYRTRGKYDLAKPLYERALAIYEDALAKNRQNTGNDASSILNHLVTLYNNLAALYQKQRKYNKAEELYRKALDMARNVLGANHPFIAQIMHDQAELYKDQGKLEEAEKLHQQALEIRKRVLEEHPDIATSLNSLGTLYVWRGNREKARQGEREKVEDYYKRAEDYYRQALEMQEKVLGLDAPETAESMYDLAGLYRNWNKVEEAEDFYSRALAIREKLLGQGDSSTLQSQKALANLYQSQGKGREAERLYEEALESRYQQLRLDDRTIERNLEYLAKLYESHQKPAKAEQLYEQAFKKYSRRLGLDDRLTQRCWQKLIELYKKGQNKEIKIEWLYVQVLDLRARSLRGDNLTTIKNFVESVKNLAELYKGQKQMKELKQLYELALRICHRQLGTKHSLTLWYRDALMSFSVDPSNSSNHDQPEEEPVLEPASIPNEDTSSIFIEQLQKEEEERLEQKLEEAYEEFGVDDPTTVQRRHELAQLYEKHNKSEEAERVYRRALIICTRELESDAAATIECQNDLARWYWYHGKYDEAKPLIHDVLAVCQPMLEKTDLSDKYSLACAHSLDNAALLYQRELTIRELEIRRRNWIGKEPTKPEVLIQQALAICEKVLGEEHDETITILKHYASLLQKMGIDDEAKGIIIRATTMQKKASKKREVTDNDAEKSQ